MIKLKNIHNTKLLLAEFTVNPQILTKHTIFKFEAYSIHKSLKYYIYLITYKYLFYEASFDVTKHILA